MIVPPRLLKQAANACVSFPEPPLGLVMFVAPKCQPAIQPVPLVEGETPTAAGPRNAIGAFTYSVSNVSSKSCLTLRRIDRITSSASGPDIIETRVERETGGARLAAPRSWLTSDQYSANFSYAFASCEENFS